MKCDRGADAWSKFKGITDHLTSVGKHVSLKINMGFANVWRKICFCENVFFHLGEFRTALKNTYVYSVCGMSENL